MIEEAYVSFEIARLLKEKGFNEGCNSYFISDNEIALISVRRDFNDYGVYLSAPTQQMAMRWLREKYNISIEINTFWNGSDDEPYKFSKYTYGFRVDTPNFTDRYRKSEFDTYEQAAEAAIRYSLKNLI